LENNCKNIECKVFFRDYNKWIKISIVLECGHTIYRECLQSIYTRTSECPFDREKFTKSLHEFKPYYASLDGLEEQRLRLKRNQKSLTVKML
jgi:hypothetical protein